MKNLVEKDNYFDTLFTKVENREINIKMDAARFVNAATAMQGSKTRCVDDKNNNIMLRSVI